MLSLPMIVEMFFEALFALADAFFVARYVGVNGVATVGLTESVLTLIYSVAMGLGVAGSALVSRRVGEKENVEASKAILQVILISLVFGLIVGVSGFFLSESILRWMGGDDQLIADGIWYTKIQFLSSPVIILLFSLSGSVRGAGLASVAMKAVIVANLINIGLDYLFIAQMGMGVKGAAIATLIGRTFGIGMILYAVTFSKSKIKMVWSQFAPDWKIISSIIKIGAGSAGQFLIQSASWIFLVRILSIYGNQVVAGYTIAIRIIIFSILPSWGLANSAATLVGQNLGAGKPERAVRSAWTIGFINMGFLSIIAAFYLIFATYLIEFFDATPEVVKAGVECLRIMSLGYVLFGIAMVITQAINGAGDTYPITVMNIICFWIIEIPLAYWLAEKLGLKETGVFLSIIISESILALLAILYFRTNRWQKTKV